MSDRINKFIQEINKLDVKVGSVNYGQIQFLTELLQKLPHIKRILETGFHIGLSAAVFLDVRDDIEVVSFDIFWFDYTRKAKLLLDKYYPMKNLLIAGNTIGSLRLYLERTKDQPIDMVFIDGGHEWPIPYYDLQVVLSYVKEDTIIVVDDYCEAHGMQGVIRSVDEIIKKGLLKDVMVVRSEDRGMIVAKRSNVPYKDEVPKDEIIRLLQDTSSHYQEN
jgi:predicted O-methyltransferase YrrM